MKELNLTKLLRKRREYLGYGQKYMGAKLNMSQSGYSWIENGKTKLTPELVQRIKEIEKFEDFDQGTPEYPGNIIVRRLTLLEWPWSITSLYITYSVVGLLLLNLASSFADDLSRGISAGGGTNLYISIALTIFFFALFCFMIYLLIRFIKRVANSRNGGNKEL